MNLSKSAQIKGSSCPTCGYFLDACTGLGEGMKEDEVTLPSEGDVTVCAMCGELLVFDKNLSLQKPTQEQMEGFQQNAELFDLLTKTQRLIRGKLSFERMQKKLDESVKKWQKK